MVMMDMMDGWMDGHGCPWLVGGCHLGLGGTEVISMRHGGYIHEARRLYP